MGRNKKDATQDVLNLYNQMQEDENIESGKDEIKVTLDLFFYLDLRQLLKE